MAADNKNYKSRSGQNGAKKSYSTTKNAAKSSSRSSQAQRKAAMKAKNSNKKKTSYVNINDGYSYSVSSNEKRAQVKRNQDIKNKRGLKTAVAISIAIVLLIGAALFVWYFFFSAGQDTFARGISVDGISISGMTYAKAQKALGKKEDEIADTINITAKAAGKEFPITKDDLDYSFNTKEILDDAMEYSRQRGLKTEDKEYSIKMTVDESSYKGIADKIAKETDKSAKNSKVLSWDPANLTFEVDESEQGFKVKKEDFVKTLSNYIGSGTYTGSVDVNSEVIEPQYSKDYISNNIILVSEFTTVSTNNEAGNTNMAIALDACNGSIIEPEETWSFNSCTGDTNQKSNGYQEAGVIVNGKHEMGVGGGICQSSTTIYNAQLMAGMVVIERTCHYYKSSYVDAGRDATVDYGNIDLKMMNPYDYQMFLRCYMDGDTLYAEIYSLPNSNWDDITIDSEVTDYFDNGYDATTTRTFWRQDEEIDTETLPSSRYYTSEPGGSTDDVVSYENAWEDENAQQQDQQVEEYAYQDPNAGAEW